MKYNYILFLSFFSLVLGQANVDDLRMLSNSELDIIKSQLGGKASSDVANKELSSGQLYPSIKDIKKVSKEIAITVAEKAFSEGLTNMAIPQDIESSLDRIIYNPVYPDYT